MVRQYQTERIRYKRVRDMIALLNRRPDLSGHRWITNVATVIDEAVRWNI